MNFYPKQTKNPSKTLYPSLMYPRRPKAPIFMNISIVKIKLKIILLISTILDSMSGWLWCSILMLKEKVLKMRFLVFWFYLRLFKTMQILIKCWNLFWFTILYNFALKLLLQLFTLFSKFLINWTQGGFGVGLKTLKSPNKVKIESSSSTNAK